MALQFCAAPSRVRGARGPRMDAASRRALSIKPAMRDPEDRGSGPADRSGEGQPSRFLALLLDVAWGSFLGLTLWTAWDYTTETSSAVKRIEQGMQVRIEEARMNGQMRTTLAVVAALRKFEGLGGEAAAVRNAVLDALDESNRGPISYETSEGPQGANVAQRAAESAAAK